MDTLDNPLKNIDSFIMNFSILLRICYNGKQAKNRYDQLDI